MQRLKNSHLWPVASWQVLTFGNVSEQAVVILALYGCWRTQSVFLQHGQPGHTGLQWDHPDFLDGRNEPRSAPWHSAQRGWEVSASCFRGAVAPGCAVSEGSPISLSYQICWSLAVCAVHSGGGERWFLHGHHREIWYLFRDGLGVQCEVRLVVPDRRHLGFTITLLTSRWSWENITF